MVRPQLVTKLCYLYKRTSFFGSYQASEAPTQSRLLQVLSSLPYLSFALDIFALSETQSCASIIRVLPPRSHLAES